MTIGLGFRLIDPNLTSVGVDEIFIHMIDNDLYTVFSGLIFIGICSASISTANSQLLVASSAWMHDIYKNISKKDLESDRFLLLTRISIFVIASISLILSISPPENLLQYGAYIWGLLASGFMVPLLGGLVFDTRDQIPALSSLVLGIAAFVISGLTIGIFHSTFVGLLVSLVSFYVTSRLRVGLDEKY